VSAPFTSRSCGVEEPPTVRIRLAIALLLLTAAVLRADDDHDRARKARLAGEVLPLSRILDTVGEQFDGTFVEAELEEDDGRPVYEIEVLTPQGNVIELTYDAHTGALLETEGRGVEAARRRR
jgi:uncharacterized membrane protein YkoI